MAGCFGDTARLGITMNLPTGVCTPSAQLAHAFTLGSALRWFEHDCSRCLGCGPIDALAASVWFIRRQRQFRPSVVEPLILLDISDTGEFLAPLTQIIADIKACAQRDGILVSIRRSGRERRHDTTAPPLTAFGPMP